MISLRIVSNARSVRAFINDFPLDVDARESLIALYTQARDFWPGKSVEQKMATLASISYREFLSRYWRLSAQAVKVFQKRPHDFFAVGIDLLPALEAAGTGYPGFDGLGLPVSAPDSAKMDEPYIYHFPDGNASIARLLVRKLIPDAAPGTTMEDIVMAPFDYSRLDAASAPTRLRLNSTVVALANTSNSRADVGYIHDGILRRTSARHVIYAGYNMMLPYVAQELPTRTKGGAGSRRQGAAGVREAGGAQLAAVGGGGRA